MTVLTCISEHSVFVASTAMNGRGTLRSCRSEAVLLYVISQMGATVIYNGADLH